MSANPLQDWLDEMFADNPAALGWQVFQDLGINKDNPFSAYLKGKLPDYLNAFQGQVLPQHLDDPQGSFLTYLQGLDPRGDFQKLAPRQRGENPSLYAPQVKFAKNPFTGNF